MLRDNEEGAALVMVMIMLIVGSIFVTVMLRSVNTHMNVAVHEEGMSQAFYSADSGVEFVKANINKINLNSINTGDYLVAEDTNNDGELEFSYTDTKYWIDSSILGIDDIKFNIVVSSVSGNPSFTSEGNYTSTSGRHYSEEIKFNISAGSGLKSFNIQKDQDKEIDEHYNEAGPGNLTEHINIYDWVAADFIAFARTFLSNGFFDQDDFVDDNEDIVDIYYENTNVNFKNDSFYGKNIIIKNGNLTMKNTTITDSIVIIDGNLDFDPPNNYISNSIILVKDYVSSQGASASADLDNNMFFIYANVANKGYYLDFRGTGSFHINPDNLPEEYQPNLSVSGWEQL